MQSDVEARATAPLPTVGAALSKGCEFLSQSHVESARLDAEILLRHVLEMAAAEFYTVLSVELSRAVEARFWTLLARRARREPVAYITGQKEFWSLDFVVTPDVLIPRPETELLVEVALESVRHLAPKPALHVLDLCTGSGAIAVCLAKERADSQLTAVDISAAAITVARRNAEEHGVAGRIHFAQGDLFAPLVGRRFALIVSNPPYVRRRDLALLAPEIRNWEPLVSLDGGDDGLDFYRRIVADAPKHSIAGGIVAVEVGADIADPVVRLFAAHRSYEPAAIHRDYAGKDRVVTARILGDEANDG
jgi:release factor glutamine methyltransferase